MLKLLNDEQFMTLYEKIKAATKTKATTEQIAAVFGISTYVVSQVREMEESIEKIEHPERFDKGGLRLNILFLD